MKLPDGGELMLHWLDNARSRRFPRDATRPTVLLLPGATGTRSPPSRSPPAPLHCARADPLVLLPTNSSHCKLTRRPSQRMSRAVFVFDVVFV